MLGGRVERPHWSARVEDVKNEIVSNALRAAGWQPRIQTYTSFGSTSQVRVLGRALFAGPHSRADHHDQPVHDMRSLAKRGFRNFMSQPDPHLGVEIVLPTLDGPQVFPVHTDRSGLIDVTLEARMAPGEHEAIIRTSTLNEVTCPLFIYEGQREGFGVVSDVDDTVLVTFLPRPLIAAWNAFVIDQASRRIVPGMPVLYQQLRRNLGEQMPFVYLSTGAWNVSPVLQRFLFKNGYPAGPLLLTDWGPTNTGIFRSGQKHKASSLEALREMFPGIKWILVGDDGQHDPQIYGDFVGKHPEDVAAVAIRQLTEDQQDLAHGAQRPFRSMSALVRVLAGLVPKVWRRTAKSGERSASSVMPSAQKLASEHANAVRSVEAKARSAGSEVVYSRGEGAPDDASAPPVQAARTSVPWVAAPDGFGLIRALRRVGLMKDGV